MAKARYRAILNSPKIEASKQQSKGNIDWNAEGFTLSNVFFMDQDQAVWCTCMSKQGHVGLQSPPKRPTTVGDLWPVLRASWHRGQQSEQGQGKERAARCLSEGRMILFIGCMFSGFLVAWISWMIVLILSAHNTIAIYDEYRQSCMSSLFSKRSVTF